MASLLKIVATPIGNVQDISLRAMTEIQSADVIFAEDTRHSKKLVQILGLKLKPHCRWISCSAQKEKERALVVVEYLGKDQRVLFMSDAGCPGISDPGSLLVQAVVQSGFGIEVIPGPSAISAALMGVGINITRFAFLGFLPLKKTLRKNMLIASANAGLALVIYESPMRVSGLLLELHEFIGSRRVVVARELSKAFETFHRGHLGEQLMPALVEKGECVVIVEAGELIQKICIEEDDKSIDDFITHHLETSSFKPKDLAQMVAIKFNIRKKKAYDLVLRSKN